METLIGSLKSVMSWIIIAILGGLIHTVISVQDLEANMRKTNLNSKLICMMAIELMQGDKKEKAIKICSELIL